MPFGVIFKTFSQMLQNSKKATLSSEMLGLGGVWPAFWHIFCLLFECVFGVAIKIEPKRCVKHSNRRVVMVTHCSTFQKTQDWTRTK